MVTLRTYRIEDEETVVTLWWDSWHSIRAGLRHPQSLADWRRRWAKDIVSRQQIVVAEADGVVVGFAAADLCNRVLDQLFVAPPHKRCGIGRQLLSWAQRVMPDGFRLHTLAENVASQAFYERNGLAKAGARINPVNGMPTIEYCWVPEPSAKRTAPAAGADAVARANKSEHPRRG